jgi:hypothetical protein
VKKDPDLSITNDGNKVMEVELSRLMDAWKTPLEV